MTALAKERMSLVKRAGGYTFPVKTNVKIYKGARVVLSAGYLAPATKAVGLQSIGRATETVDNTGGANGAVTCHVDFMRERVFHALVGDGAVAQADVGAPAYFLDDQTVSADGVDGEGDPDASAAGMIFAVDLVNGVQRVWVEV